MHARMHSGAEENFFFKENGLLLSAAEKSLRFQWFARLNGLLGGSAETWALQVSWAAMLIGPGLCVCGYCGRTASLLCGHPELSIAAHQAGSLCS